MKIDTQELQDEINLRSIQDQLKAIQQRLLLVKVEGREMQAVKTGLTVAESALESILK